VPRCGRKSVGQLRIDSYSMAQFAAAIRVLDKFSFSIGEIGDKFSF